MISSVRFGNIRSGPRADAGLVKPCENLLSAIDVREVAFVLTADLMLATEFALLKSVVLSATPLGRVALGFLLIWGLMLNGRASHGTQLVILGVTIMAVPILTSCTFLGELTLPIVVLGFERWCQVLYVSGGGVLLAGAFLYAMARFRAALRS